MFLLAMTTSAYSAFAGPGVISDTYTRVCYITCRLLQLNTLLAGAPKVTNDKFQRVLSAAARVLTGTYKFDRGLSRLLHTELHWLNIPERVTYKLGVIMFGCRHGRAPQYLIDYCLPVSDVASRQHLRSASRHLLVVPRHRLSTYGRRAFAIAGPTVWNSFPDNLRDPDVTMDNFKCLLKTFLFSACLCNYRIRCVTTMRPTNLHFTYLH